MNQPEHERREPALPKAPTVSVAGGWEPMVAASRQGHWVHILSLVGCGAAAGIPESELAATERRLGRPLPIAVREFLLQFGATELFNEFNGAARLIPLARIESADGVLRLFTENQGVVEWGIRETDLDIPDPPAVLVRYHDPNGVAYDGKVKTIVQNEHASGFFLQMTLMLKSFGDKAGGMAFLSPAQAAIIDRHFPRIPVPEMDWPVTGVRFHTDGRVLLQLYRPEYSEHFELYAGADRAEDLEPIDRAIPNLEWDFRRDLND